MLLNPLIIVLCILCVRSEIATEVVKKLSLNLYFLNAPQPSAGPSSHTDPPTSLSERLVVFSRRQGPLRLRQWSESHVGGLSAVIYISSDECLLKRNAYLAVFHKAHDVMHQLFALPSCPLRVPVVLSLRVWSCSCKSCNAYHRAWLNPTLFRFLKMNKLVGRLSGCFDIAPYDTRNASWPK